MLDVSVFAAQFKGASELMLIDLGSAHGTKVNKKPIAPNEFVRLMVGDIVGFGASSRLYVVNGPSNFQQPEYDSNNMKLYRQMAADASAQVAKQKEEELSSGIDWGFRPDAVNYDEEDGPDDGDKANLPEYIKNDVNYDRKYGKKYSSSLDESEVHEKDKEILEKIRAKERKIQNMQEENRRIYMKENSQESGLTDGQTAAVARNDNRIETLINEIDELQHKITSKNLQRMAKSEGSDSRRAQGIGAGADDDENGLYDTTADTADASTNWRLKKKLANKKGGHIAGPFSGNTTVVTYESLLKQKADVSSVLVSTRSKIESEKQRVKESLALDSNCTDDSLEGYLKYSLACDAGEILKKLELLEHEQAQKLRGIEKLLKIATPAIATVQHTPLTETLSNPIQSLSAISQGEINSPKSPPEQRIGEDEQPIEKGVAPTKIDHCANNSNTNLPKLKRKCINSDAEMKSRVSCASSDDCNFSISPHEKNFAVVKEVSSVAPPPRKKQAVLPKNEETNLKYNSGVLEGGDSAWIPPVDQTGDGRSALNDKYGY